MCACASCVSTARASLVEPSVVAVAVSLMRKVLYQAQLQFLEYYNAIPRVVEGGVERVRRVVGFVQVPRRVLGVLGHVVLAEVAVEHHFSAEHDLGGG